ncbi:MAG TPA: gamma-glutamyltransferase [Thermoanaerobaculia bacterium]|nr:gamma-glutamyltransferase [Thermoanaerobaculia bacterium]
MSWDELERLEARGPRANPWRAGRSHAMSRRGLLATSQSFATLAGVDCLRRGGTAMDAAITAAAVLAVVEPMMTGIGGDAFFLYHEAASGRVSGLNGSGRSPRRLPRHHFGGAGAAIPPASWEAVTVPGAVSAWWEGWRRFGRLPFADLLAPAIAYAEEGFPVTEVVHAMWSAGAVELRRDPEASAAYLAGGRAPALGATWKSPRLAESLRLIAAGGSEAFYRGPIAAEIARYARATGGFLDVEDFAAHQPAWVEPISTTYRGHQVLQIPPNGQGIAVLLMLDLLEAFDVASLGHATPECLHLLIEAKKAAFADLHHHVADPEHAAVPVAALLSADYAARRRAAIDPLRAADAVAPGPVARTGGGAGSLATSGDTVYLTAIDHDGNAVSFINSLFDAFGAKIVGGHTGILLHSRGSGFTLEPGHPNEYAPAKRPFHTIIPGMVLRDGRLHLSYGVMGGAFQPQGHVQLLTSLFDFGLGLQEAIDAPRWRHLQGRRVLLEHGTPRATFDALAALGHEVEPASGFAFGGAQAILVDPASGTFIGASDPRKDGCALGY